MSESDIKRLIAAWIDGRITADESETLQQELRESATARATFRQFSHLDASLRELADYLSPINETKSDSHHDERTETVANQIGLTLGGSMYARIARYATAVACVVVLAFLLRNVLNLATSEPTMAKLVDVSGAVRWIGTDGRMDRGIQSGDSLGVGTMECLSLDSSAHLRFTDGSTLAVHGPSVLTISAHDQRDQKIVTLREGNLSADVRKQLDDKPMLVRTPTAELQVLGTQFDVAANEGQTTVSVREGLVRTTRLADGKSVDVAAAHRVVASIEVNDELKAIVLERTKHSWHSDLERDVGHGKYISPEQELGMALRKAQVAGLMTADEVKRAYEERTIVPMTGGSVYATPLRIEEKHQPRVVYVVSLDVERGTSGHIQLVEGSRFRIRGSVKQPTEVTFGFSAVTRDRESGKRYMKLLSARQVTYEFDIELPITVFHGDNDPPYGLDFVNFFCFAASREAVFEITSVELIAP